MKMRKSRLSFRKTVGLRRQEWTWCYCIMDWNRTMRSFVFLSHYIWTWQYFQLNYSIQSHWRSLGKLVECLIICETCKAVKHTAIEYRDHKLKMIQKRSNCIDTKVSNNYHNFHNFGKYVKFCVSRFKAISYRDHEDTHWGTDYHSLLIFLMLLPAANVTY